jgi:NAD+ kinase
MNKLSFPPFKKIGLIGRHPQTSLGETFLALISVLTEAKAPFLIEQVSAKEAGIEALSHQASIDTLKKECDLILTLGGDGNFLRGARTFYDSHLPIIGINRGQLGYLTDIHPTHLNELLPILQGHYVTEERFLLQSEVYRHGEKITQNIALNDVVLSPGEVTQMIEFEIHVDGKFLYRQRSDGLILSTPTGSTAYSLSAGGPIVHPSAQAFLLTPMMPHSLTSRPIVINSNATIDIYLSEANKTSPKLNHDGQEATSLQVGDQIHMKQAEKTIQLIHPLSYDYYSALRSKLNWSEQPIFKL